MNINDIPKFVGLLVLCAGIIGTWYVNDYKLAQGAEERKDMKKDIEKLEADKERQVRMDERQKTIQEDVKEIKDLLRQLSGGGR